MGAFDDYQPPSKGGAFGDYKPPSSTPAPAPAAPGGQGWRSYLPAAFTHVAADQPAWVNQPSPDTLPGLDPRTATMGDYLAKASGLPYLAASGAGQIGSTADDYVRAATDAMTFGYGDKAIGALTGRSEAALTQQARARLGTPGNIMADVTGYAMGPGELGAASKIGGLVSRAVGPWVGGVLGSAAEGAAAGAAGAAGHDESIGKGALLGGALGAAGGLPGGVVGRGGALAPALSEDALRARATQEYAPLDEMIFHGPSQIKGALDAVENTMTGAEKDLAKSTMAKVGKLGDQDLASGSDIQSYQKIFGGLAKTGSDADREFAPKFKSALEGVMNAEPYGRNLTPGQGMSLMLPGPLGGTGFAAGDAAAARNAGDVWHGRAEDIARLDDPVAGWIARSKVQGGPDVGDQARSYLLSKGTFAKPGTPQYDALNTLAGTGAGQDVGAAPSAYDVRHAVHPLVSALATGAIAGAGGQIAEGHFDPAHLAAETLLGAGLGYGVHRGVPAFQAKFFQQPAQQSAIDAARSTLSTGNYQAPVLPNANLRDALRTLIFSQGARGAY